MDQLKEFKRQVEIAAIVYEFPNKYSEYDLSLRFKISPSTIRRDISNLNRMSVFISSRKRHLSIDVKLKHLNSLLSLYISLNSKNDIRNLSLIKKVFKNKTISLFVNILKAINEKKLLEIRYLNNEFDEPVSRTIAPIYLNSTNKTFLIVALENDKVKFFRIEGIRSATLLSQKYTGKIPDIHDIYRNSWGVFSGGQEILAQLKFNKKWKKYFEERILVDNSEIIEDTDSVVVNIPVKLSYEFISWVMGWGKEVVIIGPRELKEAVLSRAKDLINNHENKKNKK